MRLTLLRSLGLGFGLLTACGDDGDATSDTETTTGSTDPTTTTDPSTTTNTTTTQGSSEESSTSPTTTVADTSTGEDTSTGTEDTGTETGTETAGFDCTMVPAGPFDAERILEEVPLGASEDLAFNGQGQIAARGEGGTYLLISADGSFEEITDDPSATYGLRYLASGDLVAAAYQISDILRVTPAGDVSVFAPDVGGVNGLFPDAAGGVWYTNFQAVGYIDAEGNDITVIPGASGANGIFFDDERQIVFFTNYGSGALRKAEIVNGVAQPAEDIGSIDGAPDGITLDICGNLYAVDQGNSDLYRVLLDENAEPLGDAEFLVSFPTGVANAQFGSGDGWDPQTLYAIGEGSGLYSVPVGVPGAPYVTVR